MRASHIRMVMIVALVAMASSMLFPQRVAAIVYIAVALSVAAIFLRASDARSPYFAVAIAQVLFAAGWALDVLLSMIDVAEIAYTLAYLPVLVAVSRIMRRRVGKIEQEALLESLGLALVGTLVLNELQSVFAFGTAESGTLEPIVFLILLITGISFSGRASDASMRAWMVAALLAVVIEVGDSLTTVPLAVRVVTSFAALPYVVLLFAWDRDRHGTFTGRSDLRARRKFGPMQLAGVMLSLSIPLLLISLRLNRGETDGWQVLMVGSIALVIIAVLRVRALVRLRDWSYAIETRFRRLGTELVEAGSPSEVRSAVVAAVGEVVDGEVRICPTRDVGESGAIVVALPETDEQLEIERQPIVRAELLEQLGAAANQYALAIRSIEAREAEHQRRSDYRVKTMLTLATDVVFSVRPETRTIDLVSPSVRHVLGFGEAGYVDSPFIDSFHAPDRARVERIVFEGHEPLGADREVRMDDARGDQRWFTLAVQDLTDDPEIGSLVVVAADITERKIAELQLQRSEARNRAMVDEAQEILALVGADLSFNFVGAAIDPVLGHDPDELVGKDVRSILTRAGARELGAWLHEPERLASGEPFEVEAATAEGHARVMRVRVAPVPEFAGGGFAISTRDITDERLLAERLSEQSSIDQLTGLPNRLAFQAWLAASAEHRRRGQTVAVLAIDLDDFRLLNDAVGTEFGDELLRTVAARLRLGTRAEDQIARYAGDQFLVGTIVEDDREAEALAERLLGLIATPVDVAGQTRNLGAAIGVAPLPMDESDATVLVQQANLALGAAKQFDGSRAMTYDPVMAAEADEQFALIADLTSAIENEEISISYQPVIDLSSSRVASVEALARWEHPSRGWVSPGVFIPIAEKHGHIIGLGRFVLRRALAQLAEWDETVLDADRLRLAVNVSMLQLVEPGEVDVLLGIIERSGVQASRLTVEVTESTGIDDAEFIRAQLERFQALGCSIAIDDFGTGVAGLNHLRDMPFDVVKIDKSFIDPLATVVVGEAVDLIANIVEISQSSGAVVVAEGVETSQQSATLRRLGCDYGQGFFYGRPVPPAVLVEEFAAGRDGQAPFVIVARS